jgi:hypothetical protein
MPDNFDAYFKWLGIPPEEQPPNHYRLLAIPLLVDDAMVIEHAADRQMAHLRTFQTGKHSALSQRLLNEVAAARVCLLNPKKKAAYDDQLREALQAQQAADAATAGASAVELEIDLGRPQPAVSRSSSAKPGVRPMAWIAGGGALGLVLLGLVAWSLMPRSHADRQRTSAGDLRQEAKKNSKAPASPAKGDSKKDDWTSAVKDSPQTEDAAASVPTATRCSPHLASRAILRLGERQANVTPPTSQVATEGELSWALLESAGSGNIFQRTTCEGSCNERRVVRDFRKIRTSTRTRKVAFAG